MILHFAGPLNAWAAIGWLFADSRRFDSPLYDPARSIAPLRVWGVVVAALGAALFIAWVGRHQRAAGRYLVALAGFWGFWAVLFTVGLFTARSGWLAPAGPVAIAGLHVLAARQLHEAR